MSTPKNPTTKASSFSAFLRKPVVLWAMLAILTLVYWSGYAACFDRKIDLNGDNVYYYELGRSLAAGHGYNSPFELESTPHTHFPPGYPAFIALLIKVFHAGVPGVKAANGVLLFLAIVLLFLLARKLLDSEVIIPFAAAILAATHPDLLRFATTMMSEPLFAFLTVVMLWMAVLLSEHPSGQRLHSPLFWAEAVCLLACSAYLPFVRSMGIAMILAIALWFGALGVRSLIKKNRPDAVYFAAAALLVLLCWYGPKKVWDARCERVGDGGGYSYMFMNKSDGTPMKGLSDWGARIKTNATNHITRHYPSTLLRRTPPKDKPRFADWAVGILLLGGMTAGFVSFRKKGWLLLLLYCGATIAVLMLYREQYSDYRYYWAVIPLMFLLLLEGVAVCADALVRAVSHRKGLVLPVLCAAALAIVLLPRNIHTQKEFRDMAKVRSWESLAGRATAGDFAATAQWCGQNLPKDARFLTYKQELFYHFSGGLRSAHLPNRATPEELLKLLDDKHIEYLFVDTFFPQAYRNIMPTMKKYPQKFKTLVGGGAQGYSLTYVVKYIP